MKISEHSMIGDVVAENFRTASVFKKYGLDFCCSGRRSIVDACAAKGLNTEEVLDALSNVPQDSQGEGLDFRQMPLDLLADYIEKVHHRYVEEKTPEIRGYLEKVERVHGDRHPELLEIRKLFEETAGELAMHMKKEELMLFPYIRRMMVSGSRPESPFGTVQNPIRMMMSEHAQEGERFEKISVLSKGYTAPDDACNTYRVCFAMLQDFEDDLHKHIHLENNILFPKAIALEATLSSH